MLFRSNPLELYLTLGVSFIASGFSGQPRLLANMIKQGMEHPGFAIVHVQSPCTTYNDTFEELKGNAKKGIDPLLWDIPAEHDASDRRAAYDVLQRKGVPVGVIYKDASRPSLEQRLGETQKKVAPKTVQQLMDTFAF